jgi:hypothetical protein
MNDDDLPTRAEVASAYLAGELDAAERASVSGDAKALALVEAFTQVRNLLGDVAAVDDHVKASAISAALAQFDSAQLAATPVPARVTATVTSLHTRRTRVYRVFTSLAAAAVVLVVAIAALNSLKGSESKSSSSATEPPAAVDAQAGSPVLKAAADTASAAGTAAPGAVATELAPMVPAVNNANDLARYASTLARDIVAPAATTAAASAAGGAAPAATTPGPTPAVPPASCLSATDTVLGPISVLGAPAFAVRDTATGAVRAIAASTCQVLLTTP